MKFIRTVCSLGIKRFDWVCEKCGSRNYDSRKKCIRCGNPF